MEEQRPSKPEVIGSNPLRCMSCTMRKLKIRWKYPEGRYKTKLKVKRRKKVYSFKTVYIFKKRIFRILRKKAKRFQKKRRLLNYTAQPFKPSLGVLRLTSKRRNIIATLSSLKGHLFATITTGLLHVKGKERQATHIIRETAQLIIKKIKESKLTRLIYVVRGASTRRKKKLFYDTLRRIKKVKFKKLVIAAPRAHNGCRPTKIRRL